MSKRKLAQGDPHDVEILIPRRAEKVEEKKKPQRAANVNLKSSADAPKRLRSGLSLLGKPDSCVVLDKSTIKDAGLGIIALKRIEAGKAITEYVGEMISYEEAAKRNPSHMRTHARGRWAIDGTRLPDGTPLDDPINQLQGYGIGAFANHAVDAKTQNAKFDFVDSERNERAFERFKAGRSYDFDPAHRVTLVRAVRDIEPGEEILVDYGRDYRGFADGNAPRCAQ